MKKTLRWIQQNIVLVLSLIVMVASAPAGLVLGMQKAAKVRNEVQQDIEQRMRAIRSSNTTYTLPALLSSQPPITISRPPNKATNDAVAAYMQGATRVADEVYGWAVNRNMDNRDMLVEGLFPAPDPAEAARKLQEVASAWPPAQEQALRDVGAGAPPDPEAVAARLQALRDDAIRRAQDRGDTAEEAGASKDLFAQLSRARIAMYLDRARALTFYAGKNVIANVAPWSQERPPTLDVAWDWQQRTWMHQDVLSALAIANTDSAGVPLSVLDGPVKRIEAISVTPWTYGGQSPQRQVNSVSPAPFNFEVSFTGIGATNALYDTRYANVSLVVDSLRLPAVLDAFKATNFINVINLHVENYDAAGDPGEGYVYGGGSLVRIRLRLEFIWLREWTAPLMPESVRKALGVAVPGSADQSAPSAAGGP